MAGDKDIEALYQVPLGEFTAARNALAKARGASGGDIRTLAKPNMPAWAVNQLFWRHRDAYNALITRAHQMREAHAALLSGRASDVPNAEAAHRETIREAMTLIRALMRAAGEATSPATIEAVLETLQALPSDDTPGQLTHPLKPLGFGALLALGVQGRSEVPGPRSQVPGPRSEVQSAEARRRKARLAKERKALEHTLRLAEKVEREAEAALAVAQHAQQQLDRDHAALRDRLQFLDKQRADADETLRQRSRAAQEAANARLQAAQALGALDPLG